MVISGFNGVGLPFIIWGALHGPGIALMNGKHKLPPPRTEPAETLWQKTSVWTAGFSPSMCSPDTDFFFRSATLSDAVTMLTITDRRRLYCLLSCASAPLIIAFWLLLFIYPLCVQPVSPLAGHYYQRISMDLVSFTARALYDAGLYFLSFRNAGFYLCRIFDFARKSRAVLRRSSLLC